MYEELLAEEAKGMLDRFDRTLKQASKLIEVGLSEYLSPADIKVVLENVAEAFNEGIYTERKKYEATAESFESTIYASMR